MFKDLLIQELRYWLKTPITYFFAITFCSFSFLMMAGSAGWFDPHVGDGKVYEFINSYLGINKIVIYLNKLMMVLLPAIVGSSLYKDFKFRVHSILFSYPVNKTDYLLSRFCTSLLIVTGISFMVMLSLIIASLIPGLDPAKMGSFDLSAFSQGFLFYLLPNLLLGAALVFAIVLRFRNIYFAFIGTLFPFIFQLIIENAFVQLPDLIALLDPFGQYSVLFHTKDWTLVQKNELSLPITGAILGNRILWIGTAFVLIGFSIYKFRLHQEAPLSFAWASKKSNQNFSKNTKTSLDYGLEDLKLTEHGNSPISTLWHLSKDGLTYVLKSPIFWGTVALAIMAVVFAVGRVTEKGDMILMPITKIILLVPSAFYSVFCMLLIFIYSGLLINRERNARMIALVDSTPTPFWMYWGSKLVTMVQLVLLLLVIFMISGIIIQTAQGYYNFEPLLYIKYLLGITFPPLVIWIFAAFFIHTIIDHLYVALFILLFSWVGVGGMPQLGIDSYLLRFNTNPLVHYSDMNGFGHNLKAFFVTQGYWFGLGILLLTLVHGLWPSGAEYSIRHRVKMLPHRIGSGYYLSLILGIVMMIGFGRVIWQGEAAMNAFTGSDGDRYLRTFKQEFRDYARLPVPKIRNMTTTIELYPEGNRFTAKGTYLLENSHDQEIDTFMLRLGFDEITTFDLSVPFEVLAADSILKCYVVKLNQPVPHKGHFELAFNIRSQDNTLFERNSGVLRNGTFIKNDIFPRLGYSYDAQLPHPDDSINHMVHYQGGDSDLINLDITIGTSRKQFAIGPGELINTWQKANRRYFHYQTKYPIKFSFGVNSGEYKISKKSFPGHTLELYAHHSSNLQSMQDAITSTVAYQSVHFKPYPYEHIRVIEFPDSEGTYATAFANNIPASEIRFVTNTDPTGVKTDLSFYVPAHELIHHWWGATLIPARAQGATMLTESITEYLSLKVYEKHFGKLAAQQFLKLQHRRYWNGHKRESSIEPPLYLVAPEQQYISYGKGAVIMNGLSELLGEQAFNAFLSSFINRYETKAPPYPTSLHFLKNLQAALPDSIQSFVLNQFKAVAYLDIEALAVSENKKGEIRVTGKIRKLELMQNDPKKTPIQQLLNEWIQIGFYDAHEQLIRAEWLQLTKNQFEFEFAYGVKPASIVIDPNYLLLIKNRAATIQRLD